MEQNLFASEQAAIRREAGVKENEPVPRMRKADRADHTGVLEWSELEARRNAQGIFTDWMPHPHD